MLDDEFVEAYHHGMVVMFADGIPRLAVPRIFTYSADYPEKYAILLRLLQRPMLNVHFLQSLDRHYQTSRAEAVSNVFYSQGQCAGHGVLQRPPASREPTS